MYNNVGLLKYGNYHNYMKFKHSYINILIKHIEDIVLNICTFLFYRDPSILLICIHTVAKMTITSAKRYSH